MKKSWIILTVIISICLSACGMGKKDDDASVMAEDENGQSATSDQRLADTEGITAAEDSNQASDAILSDKEIAVTYKGNLCICYIVSSGDSIFLAGAEPDSHCYVVHKMKIEDETSEKLPVDIPEDMMIQGIAVDQEGNLHIFITDADRSVKRCEIWVTDQEGNALREIDVIDAFSEDGPALQVLSEFVIDNKGRYYISKTRSDIAKRGMIILDKDGNSLGLVDSPYSKLWSINSIAKGRDGEIYAANWLKDDDRIAVMSIDPEGLCIKECYEGVLPSGYGGCVRLRAGIDADLYLYGADGIYSYNLGEESGQKLIDEARFPFSLEGGVCNEFLADGRFLFVDGESLIETIYLHEQEYSVNAGVTQNIVFYYIPVKSSAEGGE